jgi:hypothetical protein
MIVAARAGTPDAFGRTTGFGAIRMLEAAAVARGPA